MFLINILNQRILHETETEIFQMYSYREAMAIPILPYLVIPEKIIELNECVVGIEHAKSPRSNSIKDSY